MKKYIEIGKRLRKLRAHLSQKKFAEKLGIPFRTYQRYESGERIPKGEVLYRIASICDMPVDWILRGEVRREVTDDEERENIRRDLWIEGLKPTDEEVEMLLQRRKDEARIPLPRPDPVVEKILAMLKDMDEEGRRDVLKYTEEKKLLMDLMKNRPKLKKTS